MFGCPGYGIICLLWFLGLLYCTIMPTFHSISSSSNKSQWHVISQATSETQNNAKYATKIFFPEICESHATCECLEWESASGYIVIHTWSFFVYRISISERALSILMLCVPSKCWWPFLSIFMFCLFSCETNWHKLRTMYWIWQVLTVRLINHNVSTQESWAARCIYINTGMQSIDTERASLMELAKIKIKLAL